MEAIETLNSYGIEVVSGIILGLDTDKAETGRRPARFIEQSQIPLLTINLLQALPKTPLWDRLQREGRLIHDESRDSNVDFLLPYDQVVAMLADLHGGGLRAGKPLSRVRIPDRAHLSPTGSRCRTRRSAESWANIKRGLTMLRNIFWQIGVRGNYRLAFWKFALATASARRDRVSDQRRCWWRII